MKAILRFTFLFILLLGGLLDAREWTSADQQKTFSGDYVSSKDGKITI